MIRIHLCKKSLLDRVSPWCFSISMLYKPQYISSNTLGSYLVWHLPAAWTTSSDTLITWWNQARQVFPPPPSGRTQISHISMPKTLPFACASLSYVPVCQFFQHCRLAQSFRLAKTEKVTHRQLKSRCCYILIPYILHYYASFITLCCLK